MVIRFTRKRRKSRKSAQSKSRIWQHCGSHGVPIRTEQQHKQHRSYIDTVRTYSTPISLHALRGPSCVCMLGRVAVQRAVRVSCSVHVTQHDTTAACRFPCRAVSMTSARGPLGVYPAAIFSSSSPHFESQQCLLSAMQEVFLCMTGTHTRAVDRWQTLGSFGGDRTPWSLKRDWSSSGS